jgi:hypothetical protein
MNADGQHVANKQKLTFSHKPATNVDATNRIGAPHPRLGEWRGEALRLTRGLYC